MGGIQLQTEREDREGGEIEVGGSFPASKGPKWGRRERVEKAGWGRWEVPEFFPLHFSSSLYMDACLECLFPACLFSVFFFFFRVSPASRSPICSFLGSIKPPPPPKARRQR